MIDRGFLSVVFVGPSPTPSTPLPSGSLTGYTQEAVLRISDVYSGSRILVFNIPDPKTATKERCGKKLVVLPFFCSHKFHKIENYFSFEMLKKEIWANLQRIIELFSLKVVTKLSNVWVWD
jgi:hypothetical protein